MKITAHTLVKNEENFIWYSVMSVIDYVDSVLIYDDGSSDKTLEAIDAMSNTKYGKKIILRKRKSESGFREDLTRQEMLNETKSDWILMLDGDEIWWEDSIKKIIGSIQSKTNIESIVVPTINLVGDIFHYQEAAAGKYELVGKKGHFNLRALSTKIPGLKSAGLDWEWGWVDGTNRKIQDRDSEKILFVDAPYLHASHLQRSSSRGKDLQVFRRNFKTKYEIGIPFPRDFFYPEVFFKERPDIIPSPWKKMETPFLIRSLIETPIRKIKRRI